MNMRLIKCSILSILMLFSGCSLLGGHQWSAYKVVVNVKNDFGEPVENATLESNDIKTKNTDSLGEADMNFRTAGLHVVTITKKGKVTKQIKISIPQDDNRVVFVILSNN